MISRRRFPIIFWSAWALVVISAVPLNRRWREETRDRRIALAVEWNEFRDFNARLAQPDTLALNELHSRGVTALVISPITLNDLLAQRRIQPLGASATGEPLDVTRIRFSDPALARQLAMQWSWRNVPGLQFQQDGKTALISRRQGSFAALKDADFGFDLPWIEQIRAAGITPVLRIIDDVWLPGDHIRDYLAALPATTPKLGVLFSSDDVPGGKTNGAFWRSWLKHQGVAQFLPEFKPAAAAWKMAYGFPGSTFRLHSIPAGELKDLTPDAELSRWQRAVEERSCRLLLVRIAPGDSRDSYLHGVALLNQYLKRKQWNVSFPSPRLTWKTPGFVQRVVCPMLALGLICIVPWIALQGARNAGARGAGLFWHVSITCLLGALIAAAIADTPFTRVQVIPFRGVKWAFLCSWVLCLFALYDIKEIRWMLYQYVRRRDVVFAGLALAALGYLVLRTGNAPAAFKLGWEQSLRNWLEAVFVARPRFKEFAIGHPALWIGGYLMAWYHQRRSAWDGRALIWIGMIGPISMINTFCHLHSPLFVELWRSFNGVVLGVLIGSAIVWALRRWMPSRPQISFSFAQEGESLSYQRTS